MMCDMCGESHQLVRAYRPRGRTVIVCMPCIDRIMGQYLATTGTEGSI
jgi:hypothetical protein